MSMPVDIVHVLVFVIAIFIAVGGIEIGIVLVVCYAGIIGKQFPAIIVLVCRGSILTATQSVKVFSHYRNSVLTTASAYRTSTTGINCTALFGRLLAPC